MISREDIERKYAGLTTDELLSIVRRQDDYTTLAVSIAKEELARRNVTRDQELAFEEKVEQAHAIARHNAREELNFWQICFFFFIWIPLLHFPIKQNLREDGFILKVRQAGYYSVAGFVSMVITVFTSIAFNFNNWGELFEWGLLIVPALALDKYINKKTRLL